jgi:hypothetical protein
MTRFFLTLSAILCMSLNAAFAQAPSSNPTAAPSLIEQYLLGVGVAETPPSIFADVYPLFFLTGSGGGGNIGYEVGHWQFGGTFFSVPFTDALRDWVFANASGIDARRNNAAELFVSYFLRPDRQGVYVGAIGGPEWFILRDKATGKEETVLKNYIVPRVGLRWFPFQPYVYVDTSFGAAFNVSGTDVLNLGESSFSARSILAIPFIQLGVRFPLGSQQ